MAARAIQFVVHVFFPNGDLYQKIPVTCVKAETAKSRAKKRVYRNGRLAHFYTYVPYAAQP